MNSRAMRHDWAINRTTTVQLRMNLIVFRHAPKLIDNPEEAAIHRHKTWFQIELTEFFQVVLPGFPRRCEMVVSLEFPRDTMFDVFLVQFFPNAFFDPHKSLTKQF
mmetsp:Transcript_55892/g.131908  ORF Transcript_55892/g.131908 Transcript_55892/m.131908 type:complete len:106 (+) Transcript_55892:87-404(+)